MRVLQFITQSINFQQQSHYEADYYSALSRGSGDVFPDFEASYIEPPAARGKADEEYAVEDYVFGF